MTEKKTPLFAKDFKNKKQRRTRIFKIYAFSAVFLLALIIGVFVVQTLLTNAFSNLNTEKNAGIRKNKIKASPVETKFSQKCDPNIWLCSAPPICKNELGDGNYIIVKKIDILQLQWKTSRTVCNPPQCEINKKKDGFDLVASSKIDFSSYTAREACQAAGGRLPTKKELECIYKNKAAYGDNFKNTSYWSSTEYSTNYAWIIYFRNGTRHLSEKTSKNYVRCVLSGYNLLEA